MLPHSQILFLALTSALLITLGIFGIFTAEASSFQLIISDVQTYGSVQPIEANDSWLIDPDSYSLPGLPY